MNELQVTSSDMVVAPIPDPDPLKVFFIANDPYLTESEELLKVISGVDMVISLGGVNLEILAKCVPVGKPAFCVRGPRDNTRVPPPFIDLNGNGYTVREHWHIAGLAGSPKMPNSAEGLYVSEEEAQSLLKPLPAADIFLSHAPSAGLKQSNINPYQSFEILDKYFEARLPIYHFYAHPTETTAEEVRIAQPSVQGRDEYLAIGVCGQLICDGKSEDRPALIFC